MDERDFFTERPEQQPAQYSCPRCKRRNEYMVRWMRRTKKHRAAAAAPTPGTARCTPSCATISSGMDDDVTCKTCGKRFEIPSHQSMVFLDEQGSAARGAYDPDDDNRGNRA